MSLEGRIKAEEEVLAKVFRAAQARKLSDPPHIKPCDPLNPVSSVNQSPVPAPQAPKLHLVPVCEEAALSDIQAAKEQRNNRTSDLKPAEQMRRLVSSLRSAAQIDSTTSLKKY